MTQTATAMPLGSPAPQTDKMLSRKEGHVSVIYDNPERHNAVSLDMWEAAVGILDDFRNDPNITVVVVTGAGGKAFVSGADISKFEKERSSEEAIARYNVIVEKSYAAFHEFPKPTIAMIRGYCIGGGMGLRHLLRPAYRHGEVTSWRPGSEKLGLGYAYPGLEAAGGP